MDPMDTLPAMLAYTITSPLRTSDIPPAPHITIGQSPGMTTLTPANPVPNSYWFCIIDATNPTQKADEFVVPASNNSVVPNGLDKYMTNPAYIIALATQSLNLVSVPQGALYAYLKSHGAGRELDRLEQLNVTHGCGQSTIVSYVLTTQGGSNFGYEQGSETQRVRYLMSLKGGGRYTLCEAYTF